MDKQPYGWALHPSICECWSERGASHRPGGITEAVRELPGSVVDELCGALEGLGEDAPPRQRASLSAVIASPRARTRVSGLIEAWVLAPDVSPASLAWALRAAYHADERRRREQAIELVWTGLSPEGTVLRRTDQVLLDLIRSARRTLHVVTFAAYKIPILNEAMLAAARRGVAVTLIFESPEASAGKIAFAGLDALGKEMRGLANVYVWRSRDGRKTGRDGTGPCTRNARWPTGRGCWFPAPTSRSLRST